MGIATLGPHRFRLDPLTVQWDFSITVKDIAGVGGKVVQVLGAHLGDMTVTGSFGTGGWQEQEKFLAAMASIADAQKDAQRVSNSTVQPFRFKYPPKGWDFGVYLTNYSQPGAGRSVRLDDTITAPMWQLTLFIVEDNSGLRKIAQDVYIQRLATAMGWKQTAYNGPMNMAEVDSILNGRSIQTYISEQSGFSTPTPPAASGGGM